MHFAHLQDTINLLFYTNYHPFFENGAKKTTGDTNIHIVLLQGSTMQTKKVTPLFSWVAREGGHYDSQCFLL